VHALDLLYYDALPWYIRPYLHTLSSRVELAEFSHPDLVRFADDESASPLVGASYSPAMPRARPFRLELKLRIPPAASVRLEMAYDKAFLRYEEHPPDAHRGFDVPPAIIVQLADERARHRREKWYYTRPALIEVAVPDFSVRKGGSKTVGEAREAGQAQRNTTG
jgi:phosphatidylinositol glycan class T